MSSFNPPTGKRLLLSLSAFVFATLSQAQPNISLASNAPLCIGAPVLELYETGGDAVAWSWQGPNGFTSGVQNPTVLQPSPIDAGSYRVTITDLTGNTATASIQVEIHQPKPMACNDLVHITLDGQGSATIFPQTGLEGTYELTFYVLEVFDLQGHSYGNTVSCANVGQALQYRVTDTCSGNYCTGLLRVEDKTPPVLLCKDIFYNCAIENYSPDYLVNVLGIPEGNPVQYDNCGVFTASYEDAFFDLPCALPANGLSISSAWLRRDWRATDAAGNLATCAHVIYFVRKHLNEVYLPVDTILSCNAPNADPVFTGAPYVSEYGHNFVIYPNNAYCEFATGFSDDTISVCDGTTKIHRTWTILEDCPENSMPSFLVHTQLIKIMDITPPVFSCPPDVTVNIDPFTCCAATDLPDVFMKDSCSRINEASAYIQTFDIWTNDSTAAYALNATLTTFPNNNLWVADTLASYGTSPCLPQGTHVVTYQAQDDCGNSSSCSFLLTVEDKVPPVAACDAFTKVALGVDGMSEVFAETFNDGSYDRCCNTSLYVRRMDGACFGDPDFSPSVWFCCSDIGDTVQVVFRVYDCADNFNDCMVRVLVEDKIKPVCAAPANLTVECAAFDPTLWSYGMATAQDNCCLDTLLATVNYNLFDTICNKGTILRTFRAFDCAGNSSQCTQRVLVDYRQYFYLKMPDDKIVNICDGTGNYGEPTIHFEDCELIGLSYEDEVFTIVPEGCYRIDRHWKIINWCTYNPNGACIEVPNPDISQQRPFVLPGPIVSPYGTFFPWSPTITFVNPTDSAATNYAMFWQENANCYEYKQMILVFDTKDPIIENCPTAPVKVCDLSSNNSGLWNDPNWWDAVTSSHDLCEGGADLTVTAYDACTGANIRFRYLLFLDLDNNGTMETVVNSNNPPPAGMIYFNNAQNPNFSGGELRPFDLRSVPATQKYNFSIHETIVGNKRSASVKWKTALQLPLPGNPFGLTGIPPELPYGRHKIKWLVEDGCTNESFCEYIFEVNDCKSPTVVCLNGLSTNIEPTGTRQLWASDFLQYTDDNCTPVPMLELAIRKVGSAQTGFPLDTAGHPVTSITFDCSEIGMQSVELWSRDLAGNADFCVTTVVVEDNAGVCGANQQVSGAVLTEQLQGVEEVNVLLAGSSATAPNFSYAAPSNNNGQYLFPAIPAAANFTITPEKDDNPTNGVTTYDLVEISKHILGIKPLDSPYKMIAADANHSGSITSSDIVDLRKLVLGIYADLPNNTSWRFVDKSYQFPNPQNPFQEHFPEMIQVNTPPQNIAPSDFIAVKIGDVNGSAVANALHVNTDARGQNLLEPAYFVVNKPADCQVVEGEIVSIKISTDKLWTAFQFTLNFKGLEVLDLVPEGALRPEHISLFAEPNVLTLSCDQTGEAILTLKCKATRSGMLQQMLAISSDITAAAAYKSDGTQTRLLLPILKYGAPNAVLFQEVQPNPFYDKAKIYFSLPNAAEVALKISDGSGRQIWGRKAYFGAGDNHFDIDLQGNTANGILYLTLETEGATTTGKMIRKR